ncbi:MAG: sugar ABC transporter permease [Ruminococcaceae bacterium]|nr:sugar ABC transporter permease [Oscillospiraceae bacterium]
MDQISTKQKKKACKAVQGERLEPAVNKTFGHRLAQCIKRYYWLYIFIIPMLVWYIIFHYVPMGGIVIAFKRYNGIKSVWDSKWVGMKWFIKFFESPYFWRLIRNTLSISLYTLATFPLPIIVALFFNELRSAKFKKFAQTIMYAPHFVSVVVLISMLSLFFSAQYGMVNHVIKALGGEAYSFLIEEDAFIHMYVWSGVWQGLGWNCIIYIAALSSVDPGLHEAAKLDGASRLQRIWHINLPTILPTVVITFIMKVGQIMTVGADKVLLMRNDLNVAKAEVISTYVYYNGLLSGDYGYGAAVGLFTNVINLIMLLIVNYVSGKLSDTSLF